MELQEVYVIHDDFIVLLIATDKEKAYFEFWNIVSNLQIIMQEREEYILKLSKVKNNESISKFDPLIKITIKTQKDN